MNGRKGTRTLWQTIDGDREISTSIIMTTRSDSLVFSDRIEGIRRFCAVEGYGCVGQKCFVTLEARDSGNLGKKVLCHFRR